MSWWYDHNDEDVHMQHVNGENASLDLLSHNRHVVGYLFRQSIFDTFT